MVTNLEAPRRATASTTTTAASNTTVVTTTTRSRDTALAELPCIWERPRMPVADTPSPYVDRIGQMKHLMAEQEELTIRLRGMLARDVIGDREVALLLDQLAKVDLSLRAMQEAIIPG